MLSVIYAKCHIQALYDERRYAECRHAECRHAECHYADCHYAECHHPNIRVGWKSFLGIKHLSLLQRFVNYSCIKFCNIATGYAARAKNHTKKRFMKLSNGANIIKLFTSVIYKL